MNAVSLTNTKAVLRSLITSAPTGLTVSDLERDYFNQEGRRIPFVELGYNRLNTFLQSINDTLKMQMLPNGQYQVYGVVTEASAHIHQLVAGQKNNKINRNRPRNRAPKGKNSNPQLKSFYGSNPVRHGNNQTCNPILPHLHSSNVARRGYATCNNPSLTKPTAPQNQCTPAIPAGMEDDRLSDDLGQFDYEDAIPEKIERRSSKTSLVVSPNVKPLIHDITRSLETIVIKDVQASPREVLRQIVKNGHNAAEPFLHQDDTFSSVSTDETVTYGTYIEPSVLPKDVEPGSLIRVFITEINSPSRFWFHIQADRHPLDFLMYNIEKKYSSMKPCDHRIHNSDAFAGRICAAFYLDIWHRGEIVRYEMGQDSAVVHFIDYGTTTTIEMVNIKFLLSEFAKEPSQVYRGCLDYIQPIGERWSRDATYAFLGLANDIMLYAKVTEIDPRDQVLRMLLINTRQENDVQINGEMILRGLAEATPQYTQETSPMPRHPSEIHPTFAQLESGRYPSFQMVGFVQMHEIGLASILDGLSDYDDTVENTNTLLASSFHPTNPFRSMLLAESAEACSDSSNESKLPPERIHSFNKDILNTITTWDTVKPLNGESTIGF